MEWKPVDGYNGRYDVSSLGQVRATSGKMLKLWINDQGYTLVRLSRPRRVFRVHRLVAGAFIPNPNSLPVVNHLDCNRSNNHVENLEWCTQWHNLKHSDDLGRMQRDYWKGKRSPNAAITDDQANLIRSEYEKGGVSWARLGDKFGISKRSVGRIIMGETYV